MESAMSRSFLYVVSLLFLVGWCGLPLPQPIQTASAELAVYSARDRIHHIFARKGLVVSQEALGVEVSSGSPSRSREALLTLLRARLAGQGEVTASVSTELE